MTLSEKSFWATHPLFQKNGPWVTSQRKNEICFAILHLLDAFHPMTAPPEIFATNDKHVFQMLIVEEGTYKKTRSHGKLRLS